MPTYVPFSVCLAGQGIGAHVRRTITALSHIFMTRLACELTGRLFFIGHGSRE